MSEVAVYRFTAAVYSLNDAAYSWVLVHGAVQVYVFMDEATTFRIVGWVEATGDVLIKHALTAECIWLNVNDYFVQFTNASDETLGVSFADAAAANEASKIVLQILESLRHGNYGSQSPSSKLQTACSFGLGPTGRDNNANAPPPEVASPLHATHALEPLTSEFPPPSPTPPNTRTKRSASVPQSSTSLAPGDARRGSFPLASAPRLRCPSSPSSSASSSRNSSRRQSLANFEEVEQAVEAAIDATTTPPKTAIESPKLVQYTSTILPEDEHISRPYRIKQEMHVTFNAELARYEGLPLAWRGLNKQFGLPIDAVPKRKVDGYEAKIPAVLQMMKEYLVQHGGLETEGIFRLAPDRDACAAAKEAMNNGVFAGCNDVHIIANLIKVWFRELPDSLFNVIPEKLIYKACGLGDPVQVLRVLTDVPASQKDVILWLLDLMAAVVLHEKATKMSAKNMAIVLSPNLFSIESDNPMVALTMSQKVAEFTTVLLKARLELHHGYISRA
ncbi:hypothetical protein ACHHYP_03261 [Achlya hypogyna]|uniref:Rho-GAP domain-containing protein n=1 Tax=Achlya hypogyna TaxID=1202772 RepID=A0A1V9ZRL1_ACHHY|nr:hypothetical protein ACHHYP_03261 [Achlya hypogyna]